MNSNYISREFGFVLLAAILAGIGVATSIDTLVFLNVAVIGYALIAVVVLIFYRYPYPALLVSIVTKPIVDMFWYTKTLGVVSPLFVAGVTVPMLAFIRRKSVTNGKTIVSRYDRIVSGYLAVFMLLTLLKIIKAPYYAANSLESFARIASVTLFFFIGKYYFRTDNQKRQLILALVLSAVVPFIVTMVQKMFLGGGLLYTSELAKQGYFSAFYIQGRHDLYRISGIYEGVYELAFIGLFVTLIMFTMKISVKRFPVWGYIMLFLGGYFLYMTYSRSAWSLFAAAILVFCFMQRRMKLVAVILACFAILYIAVPNVQYRFEDELGFFLGRKEFTVFGYGRGGLWKRLLEGFFSQEILDQLIGNYGLGNPENQFLGTLLWFGYTGLMTFVTLITILSVALWKSQRFIQNNDVFLKNMQYMFAAIIICSYWIAGMGNQFQTMITTQWTLWIWTGILLGSNMQAVAQGKAEIG